MQPNQNGPDQPDREAAWLPAGTGYLATRIAESQHIHGVFSSRLKRKPWYVRLLKAVVRLVVDLLCGPLLDLLARRRAFLK